MAVRQDLQDVNEGKYSNVLLFLAVGVLLYILIRGWQKTVQQTTSDAIGGDSTLMLAQQFHAAFNPSGFGYLIDYDGTDVTAVNATAGQVRDYQAVAKAYRTLYNSDLSDDLANELTLQQLAEFWRIIDGAKTTTSTPKTTTGTTTTTNTGTTTTGVELVVKSLVNKTCVAKQAVNVRLYKEPAYVSTTLATGDKYGQYVAEADLTVNGSKGRFVHVKKAALGGLYYVDYWILKSALTFL